MASRRSRPWAHLAAGCPQHGSFIDWLYRLYSTTALIPPDEPKVFAPILLLADARLKTTRTFWLKMSTGEPSFDGYKQSGIGREVLGAYTQTKAILVAI